MSGQGLAEGIQWPEGWGEGEVRSLHSLGSMAQACHSGEGLPTWPHTCSHLTFEFFLWDYSKQASGDTW